MTMKTLIIEVSVDELEKLNKYKIVKEDVALREFISKGDIGELDDYSFDEVLGKCKKAILNNNVGVNVEIELGRSPQDDERTYTLMRYDIVDSGHCGLRTKDMIDYIDNYRF